jgi:hypothetical protein
MTSKHRVCTLHSRGVDYRQQRPFYVAGCEMCEWKKAAGIITGAEPPPERHFQPVKFVPKRLQDRVSSLLRRPVSRAA